MTGTERSGAENMTLTDVLLKVVAVHVGAPAVVAAGPAVAVAVSEIPLVSAVCRTSGVAVIKTVVQGAVAANGRGVIAAISVEVKG